MLATRLVTGQPYTLMMFAEWCPTLTAFFARHGWKLCSLVIRCRNSERPEIGLPALARVLTCFGQRRPNSFCERHSARGFYAWVVRLWKLQAWKIPFVIPPGGQQVAPKLMRNFSGKLGCPDLAVVHWNGGQSSIISKTQDWSSFMKAVTSWPQKISDTPLTSWRCWVVAWQAQSVAV